MFTVQSAFEEYREMGLDPIPLCPLNKNPLRRDWSHLAPDFQWQNAPKNANIGLRCGGLEALCVIDSDDKIRPTWGNVQNFLWGLGLEPDSYPVITTPHHGKHVYLTLAGSLENHARKFKTEFGAGELRYGPGAIVAAPPSTLPDGEYRLASGNINRRPMIRVQDLTPILDETLLHEAVADSSRRRPPSRKTLALLRGEGVEYYPSRSEAEQAILTNLVDCGFSSVEVLEFFLTYPAAGKFSDLFQKDRGQGLKWLENSYQKALNYISEYTSPILNSLDSCLEWAQSRPWPGRTGSYDRAVYLANLGIAYRCVKTTYAASSRQVAEIAGISRPAAERAIHRLMDMGLLRLEKQSLGQNGNEYELLAHTISTLSQETYRVDMVCAMTAHDAFRFKGLGKSAAEIFSALQGQRMTKTELAQVTGRNYATVARKLDQMSHLIDPLTGEIVQMVQKDGMYWYACEVDLEHIAKIVGTAGAGARQKKQHSREREWFRKATRLEGNLSQSGFERPLE